MDVCMKKKETSENGRREREEEENPAVNHFAFARPWRTNGRADRRTCVWTYEYVRERATDGGTYRRSTLSLNGRKKVAEVDGGAALVDRNRRTRRSLVNFYRA